MVNQRVRRRLMTAGRKKRATGLSNSICRLVLVAGCSEKNISNSNRPGSPVSSISTASHHTIVRFLRHSITKMPMLTPNINNVHARGEMAQRCNHNMTQYQRACLVLADHSGVVKVVAQVGRQKLLLALGSLHIGAQAQQQIIAESGPRMTLGAGVDYLAERWIVVGTCGIAHLTIETSLYNVPGARATVIEEIVVAIDGIAIQILLQCLKETQLFCVAEVEYRT